MENEVRIFPEQSPRVESGSIQFGKDWPGLFLRGDNALGYAMYLDVLIATHPEPGLYGAIMKGFAEQLRGVRVGSEPLKQPEATGYIEKLTAPNAARELLSISDKDPETFKEVLRELWTENPDQITELITRLRQVSEENKKKHGIPNPIGTGETLRILYAK